MANLSEAEKLNSVVKGVSDHYNEIVKNESASGGACIKPFCVDGAIIQCTMGSAPGKLTVLDHGVAITNKFAAHDEDRVPFTNIPAFGVCAITGAPCVPSPVPKWILTDEFSIITNKRGAAATSAENCALTTDSLLVCMQGGIIKFVTSGQVITIGEMLELLKSVLFLLNTLLMVNQLNKLSEPSEPNEPTQGKSPSNTGRYPRKGSISAKLNQYKEQIIKNLEDLNKELSDIFEGIAENTVMDRPATLEERQKIIEKSMLEMQNNFDKLSEIWDQITVTEEEKNINYQNNIKQSLEALADTPGIIDSSGRIIDQGKLSEYLYGSYTANENSCGAIATYNVLKGFGEDPDFAEILNFYERQNSPVLGGKYGTWPGDVYHYFLDNGYYIDSTYLKSKMKKMAENADSNIIFYGGKSTEYGSYFAHYIEAVPVGDGKFHFYNDIYGEENDIRTWDEFFKEYKGVQICYSISKPDSEE